MIAYWKQAMLQRYAEFDGRSNRAEFWWTVLGNAIIGIVLSLLGRASTLFLVLYVIWAIATLIPNLAVGIRRLHDTDRSGWWYLIILVPFIGAIVLIVWWATAGPSSPNQYGERAPDPA